MERKLSWPLLSSSMASSSRCCMPSACDCWMELAWEVPWASASLMAVEQWASASLIEWAQVVSASLMEQAQTAFASLMDSSVLDSFRQRVIPNWETNFCQWVSTEDLTASQSPKALLASSPEVGNVQGRDIAAGPQGFDCRGVDGRDLLWGQVIHFTFIWGAHLGGCIHWFGEIF